MRFNFFINEAELGNMVIKPINQCSEQEIQDFFDLVDAGHEAYIDMDDVKRHAKFLAFYYVGDDLASVSAIKDDYRKEDVFDSSGTDEDPDDYKYEMGWSYTVPKYRRLGLNYKLFMGLWNKIHSGIFATIRTTNKESLGAAKKKGYKITGEPMDVGVFDIYLLVKKR